MNNIKQRAELALKQFTKEDNKISFTLDSIEECNKLHEELSNHLHMLQEITDPITAYDLTYKALEFFKENGFEIDEYENQFAESNVPIYNAELTEWLALHLNNLSSVNESIEEFGIGQNDILNPIKTTIYQLAYDCISDISNLLDNNYIFAPLK